MEEKTKKCIIVRYSEIGLKGGNKADFEKKLANNIKSYMKQNKIAYDTVNRKFSRIIIYTNQEVDLTPVYGISSYSKATITELDTHKKQNNVLPGRSSKEDHFDKIKEETKNHIKDFKEDTTFRVSSQRLDKRFPMKTPEIDRELGSFIVDKTNSKVKLKGHEKEIGVEILPGEAYVFEGRRQGPGGLPVGIEGTILALIEDKESIRAAKLMMKRGCDVVPIGVKETNLEELQVSSPMKITIKKIKNIKESENLAEEHNAKALVSGQNLKNYEEINTKLIVLRPLIAD